MRSVMEAPRHLSARLTTRALSKLSSAGLCASSRPLARDGYAALADAERALLGDLAAAIADSLR